MNKFTYVIFFAALFSIIGYFLPQAYHVLAPADVFYKIESPLLVAPSVVQSCDEVTISGVAMSSVVSHARTFSDLVLIDIDGEETVAKFVEEIEICSTPGTGVLFKKRIKIPCGLSEGIYFFRGIVDFEVGNNILKHGEFYTETFEIK